PHWLLLLVVVTAPERKVGDLQTSSFLIDCVSSSLSLPNQAFSSFVFRSAMEDEIELKTAPADFRFPTTNQTRHCFTRYIEFHRCTTAKGEDSNECERFAKYYRALCPGEWVDKWNEQRETGTFPGPL
ncbi:Cytochrome c oxidase subunit VIb superfamily, partial [Arabidopsis suecica]